MLKTKSFLIVLILIGISISNAQELKTWKMEKVAKEILDVFVDKELSDNSKELRKHISKEWLDENRVKINNYKINSYSPETYSILYSGGDICVATISGASWSHMLIFKFTEEGSSYRVVPKGISKVSNDYIDPWYFVQEYLSSEKNEK